MVRQRWLMIALFLGGAELAVSAEAYAVDTALTVGRFFGPCTNPDTKIDQASGEACIIQTILDRFSVQDNGVKVDMLPVNWDRYYEQLEASYKNGTPPDVHILHRHRLPNFYQAQALAPLGNDLAEAGIDLADWEPHALKAVTIDDVIFGVPFDMHANLWHINLEILSKAGLVGDDGRPILPQSPGELLDHAKQVQEATGKDYLAADFTQFPIGVRAVLALLWQQGKNIHDGLEVTIDTPEMRAAVTTITTLFDAAYADPSHNYEDAQEAFLNNQVAILINGTWAVELYDREASKAEVMLTDYDVANFPTLFGQPATWADSHLWVVPADLMERNPEKYQAALKLLVWINDHNLDWARTGHLAIRTSVLDSQAYETLPHRLDYKLSSKITSDIPPSKAYNAVQDALTRNLQSIWRDEKSLDQALKDAEAEVESQAAFPVSDAQPNQPVGNGKDQPTTRP
ncbi:MAG: extracellular solute-binding protein [Geminicoccaceae bacterium]